MAAVMASNAALRSGSGLITLFHPAGLEDISEIKLTEVMTKLSRRRTVFLMGMHSVTCWQVMIVCLLVRGSRLVGTGRWQNSPVSISPAAISMRSISISAPPMICCAPIVPVCAARRPGLDRFRQAGGRSGHGCRIPHLSAAPPCCRRPDHAMHRHRGLHAVGALRYRPQQAGQQARLRESGRAAPPHGWLPLAGCSWQSDMVTCGMWYPDHAIRKGE